MLCNWSELISDQTKFQDKYVLGKCLYSSQQNSYPLDWPFLGRKLRKQQEEKLQRGILQGKAVTQGGQEIVPLTVHDSFVRW